MTTAHNHRVDPVVTKERLLGSESRWRRFGKPTPAGEQSSDYGVFGPDSVAWEVLLHPATIVFQSAAQFVLQLTYKPIFAGVRDWDPISRKARVGELTVFDLFDRAQRNSGIHAPMWLGDTTTARRVATHLGNIHRKVAGDVIDVGDPSLGSYDANSPRDSMWAALTEMHTMLWVYESLAFRDGHGPRRLSDEKRDQFIAEVAEYCKLFPAADEILPTTMSELRALYERDERLFGQSPSMAIIPDTGENYPEVVEQSLAKNRHPSQFRVRVQLWFQNALFRLPVLGAVSGKTRRSMHLTRRQDLLARSSLYWMRPLIWLLQQPMCERYFMRMMWGPDAVELIRHARELQRTRR
ncbi:hypothetical protein FIV07_15815 [Mycobacterium sp. THAF192]|nr:hypothetical protein FIV07_15815 [Mycobacterium sp. THAF192]